MLEVLCLTKKGAKDFFYIPALITVSIYYYFFRRPIVDFAIENKAALTAREKRLERSKMNNPNFAKKDGKSQHKGIYKICSERIMGDQVAMLT